MTRPPRTLRVPLLLFALLAVSVAPAVAAEGEAPPWPPLGIALDDPGAARDAPATGDRLLVRLVVRWERVESESGVYDWTDVAAAVRVLRSGNDGTRIVLALAGSHPRHLPDGGLPSASRPEALDAWLAFVRSATRTFAGEADVIEVGDRVGPGTAWSPAEYAFVLKNSALAIRAESAALGATTAVAQGALASDGLEWQRRLWQADSAAYVDVLPVWLEPGRDAATRVAAVMKEALAFPPAATVIAYMAADPTDRWGAASSAVTAVEAGADAALAAVASADVADVARFSAAVGGVLSSGFAPAPRGVLSLTDPEGGARPDAAVLGRFVSDEDFSTLVAYRAPGDAGGSERDRLTLDTALVRDASVLDPLDGRERRVSVVPRDDGATGRVARVFRAPWPLLLRFARPVASPGFEVPTEEIETARSREPTAEEIVARYQAVQQTQDDLLERWIGRGRTDLHFKLAQGGASIDVSIEATYLWQRGQALEWEQTEYFINGNRVRWKKIPELPLIQPEKVVTLPLDLTLDKTYLYRLIGRDTVDGFECYQVEFQPAEPDSSRSLYRGRVWIDVETFVRRKATVIQTNLEAPVISNEEVDRFRPYEGPGGDTYYLLDEIYGQQIWKAGGGTFVVQRELRFDSLEINPPREAFEARRAQAYASNNQMLRDTDDGFRYLERQDDGTRTVKNEVDTSQIFLGGGAFSDSSSGGVTPLAGVNYFNYDLWDRNIQVNAFFAGVLGFFTASDPDVGGTGLDATVNAFLSGLKFGDEVYLGNDELVAERLRTRNQNVSFQLGVPAGQFFKVNLGAAFSARRYFDDDDANDALAAYNTANPGQSLEFRLPTDHEEFSTELELEFNRRGFTVIADAERSRRSDWEPWGMYDATAAEFVAFDAGSGLYAPAVPEPLRDRFTTWSLGARKEWFLRSFQKLRGEVNYLDGTDLDRFSRYQFSLFGDDRLSGFSGTGVRFDQGLIGRVGYSFNLFEAIRFDGVLESARVKLDDVPGGAQSFTGVGLSANLVGPWKTVINFNYGYALASDIPDLEGEQEFLLIILKLF